MIDIRVTGIFWYFIAICYSVNWDDFLIVKILGLTFGPVEIFGLLWLDNCKLTYEVLLTFNFNSERELACGMDVFGNFLIGFGREL